MLDQFMLIRLAPILEPHMLPKQAGFRLGWGTIEQVLALTSYIEAMYKKKIKQAYSMTL